MYFGKEKIAYIRLHGFGKPSMYNYRFSKGELQEINKKIQKLGTVQTYVLFNNIYMYDDALRFRKSLAKK